MPPQNPSPQPMPQPPIPPAPAPPQPQPMPQPPMPQQPLPPQPDIGQPVPPQGGPAPSASPRKLIIWVSIGLVLLIIAGVAAYILTRPKNTANNTSSTPSTSSNTPASTAGTGSLATTAYSGTGFSITPPAGWSKVSTDLIKADVIFATSKDITSATNSDISMILVLESTNTGNKTLKQIADAGIASQQKNLTNFKLLSRTDVTVGSQPAVLLNISYDQGQLSYKNYLLETLKGSKLFVITGASTNTNWDKYSGVIKQSLLSFN